MSIRFLILSDTHDSAFPDPGSLPPVDVIIHCGDLTMIGGLSNYRKALEALSRCPTELKLVIPGNHDVDLDPEWWAKCLDEDDDPEQPERTREWFALFGREGVMLLEEGKHVISLQDGRTFTVFASPYTPEFDGYAFAYAEDEDRFNTGVHTIPPDTDVVITHGPPFFAGADYRLDRGGDGGHCGCPSLGTAIERVRPRLHCFGHIHEGYGSQIVRWGEPDGGKFEDVSAAGTDDGHTRSVPPTTEGTTLLVNAAMVAHEGQNKPWVVGMTHWG